MTVVEDKLVTIDMSRTVLVGAGVGKLHAWPTHRV